MRVPNQPHTPLRFTAACAKPLIGRLVAGIGSPSAAFLLILPLLGQFPQSAQAQRDRTTSDAVAAVAPAFGWVETGTASWYGPGFAGRPTASGETYDPHNLTAAHRSLPLGSLVRVQNLDNDRHMVVRINDRGPFVNGRVIDVSQAAAEVLGFRSDGLTKVRITAVAPPPGVMSTAALAQSTSSTAVPNMSSNTTPPTSPPADTTPTRTTAPEPAPAISAPEDPAPAFVTESTLREATSSSEDVTASQYFIQIGAFRESRHADELLQSSGALGFALRVESTDGMYRVLAGPFESSAAAQEAAQELARAGMNTFVRRAR